MFVLPVAASMAEHEASLPEPGFQMEAVCGVG